MTLISAAGVGCGITSPLGCVTAARAALANKRDENDRDAHPKAKRADKRMAQTVAAFGTAGKPILVVRKAIFVQLKRALAAGVGFAVHVWPLPSSRQLALIAVT